MKCATMCIPKKFLDAKNKKLSKKSKPYRKSIKRPTNTPSNENDAWNRKRKKNTS